MGVGYPKPPRYLPRIASWFWVSPSPWTPIAWSKSEPFWLRRVRSQRPLAASVLLGAPLAIRYWSRFIDKLNISHSLTILLVATSQTLARSVVLSARHQDFLSPCLASLGDKIVALYNRLLFLIGACPLFVCLIQTTHKLSSLQPKKAIWNQVVQFNVSKFNQFSYTLIAANENSIKMVYVSSKLQKTS